MSSKQVFPIATAAKSDFPAVSWRWKKISPNETNIAVTAQVWLQHLITVQNKRMTRVAYLTKNSVQLIFYAGPKL